MNIIRRLKDQMEGFAEFGEPAERGGSQRWFVMNGLGNDATFDDGWSPTSALIQFVAITPRSPCEGLIDAWDEFIRRLTPVHEPRADGVFNHVKIRNVLTLRAGDRIFPGEGVSIKGGRGASTVTFGESDSGGLPILVALVEVHL